MRQCFTCQEKFPDDVRICPACGQTRSFTIAGTSRITKASTPTTKTVVRSIETDLPVAALAQNPATWSYNPQAVPVRTEQLEEWIPSGLRWGGITIVGILFPPLAAISLFGTETVFLLIIQWLAVVFGCFLIFEVAWAEWLGGAFAMFTILKEVRGGIMSLMLGHPLQFVLSMLVSAGLILALIMLRQGYAHPGTKKLVVPAISLIAIGLLLVLSGALAIHEHADEVPVPDPYSEHDRKTQEAAKFMEESINPPAPRAPPEQPPEQ